MGWERSRYYTRKIRRGHKVTSQYVGRGPTAELVAAADDARLAERKAARDRIAEDHAQASACRREVALLVRLELLVLELHLGDKLELRRGEWIRRGPTGP